MEKSFLMDSGRSWLVLMASFFSFMLNFGMIVSFGVYFVALLEAFQCSRAEAALVGSVAYGATCLCGPLAAILFRSFGSQVTVMSGGVIASVGYFLSYFAGSVYHLVATQGIVGFGYGICITSLLSVQTEYFDKYRFFALSFVTVGSALGLFVLPPVFTLLIEEFTWRGSMLVNSGLALQIVVLGAILKPNRTHKNLKKQLLLAEEKNNSATAPSTKFECATYFQFNMFRDTRFIILCLECFLWGGSAYVYFAMINAVMKENDIPKERSAIIVSVSGACNCFGRVSASLLAHRKGTNRPLLYSFATLLLSLQLISSVFCKSEVSFGISAGLFGLGFGLMLATLGTVIVELFGVEKMPTAQGFVAFFIGVGGLSLPVLAGELADAYNLKVAFGFAGCVGIVASALCFSITFIQCHKRRKEPEEIELELKCATPVAID